MKALRVAFAGTPEFAVPALEALLGSGHTVVGVLTQPDRPAGRGRQLTASPVKVAAVRHGLPLSQPQTLKSPEGRADLEAWHADVLVVVAYGLILPKAALELPRFGCVNIHASLLPRWRGAAPIQRAILEGDARTGITIMRMDAGLDTGPMLLQRPTPIEPDETAGSLHDRLAALGAAALLESLLKISEDQSKSTPQPSEGVTYAAKIEKKEALIDWSRPAVQIARQVRAFNPSPIAETRLRSEQLRVYRARALPFCTAAASPATAPADPAPRAYPTPPAVPTPPATFTPPAASRAPASGEIVAITDEGIVVACGTGQLVLTEVQRPGKRPVAARDLSHSIPLMGRRLG